MTENIPKLNSTINHERASAREEKNLWQYLNCHTKIKY